MPNTPPIAGAEDSMPIAGGSDEKNIFGEDRQQRPVIANADDDKVEHYQGENDRFGEKEI